LRIYRGDIFDSVDLSPTAYVILGMVSREARSGYEIKALVDHTTRFFWAASYGQIYPELKRLSEAGLVEGVDAPRGERKRTVYEITADGEEELGAWLRQPPSIYEMRDEGLLKLFFAGALPQEEAVSILRSMREHHRGVLERLREIEPKAAAKDAGGDPFPLMVLRGGIEFNEWFAKWCERMEAQILAPARPKERSK
jgi:DNA-binding PadR family transcriptional regulator